MVLVSGGCAILYALAAVQRRFYLFAVIGVLEAFVFGALGNVYANNELLISPHSPLRGQLLKLGLGGVLTLVAGYALFVAFFQREGARYFKAHTEIALAQEIHRALVPKIERTIGQFSIYGASLPSGEVGGDLVDVVVRPESPANGAIWTAYIADVSGHGVSAGVLMAMFKTAVRTSVMAHNSSDALLNEVHRALYPLKTPNMFVTAGVLHCDASAKLTLSLAGHPPLLHFRNATGEVIEYAAEDLPLGILPEQTFQTREVPVGQGDVFALLTDGMTRGLRLPPERAWIGAGKSGVAQPRGASVAGVVRRNARRGPSLRQAGRRPDPSSDSRRLAGSLEVLHGALVLLGGSTGRKRSQVFAFPFRVLLPRVESVLT